MPKPYEYVMRCCSCSCSMTMQLQHLEDIPMDDLGYWCLACDHSFVAIWNRNTAPPKPEPPPTPESPT